MQKSFGCKMHGQVLRIFNVKPDVDFVYLVHLNHNERKFSLTTKLLVSCLQKMKARYFFCPLRLE